MLKSVLIAAVAGSAWAVPLGAQVEAACKGNKSIDNFANWANKTNALGANAGDDKTMAAATVSGGTLSLTVKSGSYFYENLPCEDFSAASGYNGLSFKLGGPAQSSFLLEVQTRASCNATAHASVFHNVTVPAGTAAGVTAIPFSAFNGTNLTAVTSLTFSTFNKTGVYTLSDVEILCNGKFA